MPHKATTEPSLAEMHVLGAGKGESIVLRWPGKMGDEWGVVDCFASSVRDPDTNHTLRFLQERGVNELAFLCLTHPHDDHFLGMSQLLQRLKVNWFWRFAGISARDLVKLTSYMMQYANQVDNEREWENAKDFARTLELAHALRDKGQLHQKAVTGIQQLYPTPADPSAQFQIWSFAPPGDRIDSYERALAASFDASGDLLDDHPEPHHNSVSVGLIVKFGATRIILGGDVEKAAWTDIRRELPDHDLHADAVKVSHHGSETGYVGDLWTVLAGKKKPIAVIAPYRRFKLPKKDAIDHIKGHVSKIMLTCEIEDEGISPVRQPLKARLHLRTKRKARSVPAESDCGRCTLKFDAAGKITTECHSPADELACEAAS
jgi:beta-lactamase superfamily II metal-dependent hydrolase